MRPLPVAFCLLLACPMAEEPDRDPTPDEMPTPDMLEVEPNDELPQDLGLVTPPFSLDGEASRCGQDGDWADADIDRFRFRVGGGGVFRLSVEGHGDWDLSLQDEDTLLWVGDHPGTDPESQEFSVDPDRVLDLVLRCWSGEDAKFRLVLSPES